MLDLQTGTVCDPGVVFRVGYEPNPWAWTDWRYAHNGRFEGRWDAEDGAYRTTYAGNSVYDCLVEVLARFRPDPDVLEGMSLIDVDSVDQDIYPTVTAGVVDRSWFSNRRIGRAHLSGSYCAVTLAPVIAALRPTFLSMARDEFGLDDFDASALQNSRPRALTQRVGRLIYGLGANDEPFDGVRFLSRHGHDIVLWAVFERSTDNEISARLRDVTIEPIDSVPACPQPGTLRATHVLGDRGLDYPIRHLSRRRSELEAVRRIQGSVRPIRPRATTLDSASPRDRFERCRPRGGFLHGDSTSIDPPRNRTRCLGAPARPEAPSRLLAARDLREHASPDGPGSRSEKGERSRAYTDGSKHRSSTNVDRVRA